MLLTHSDFEKLLETREPTAEELTAINAYCPMGSDPWEASELLRFPMMASNNLIHGSLMAWDETALTTMVASYPGCPLMIDHEWDRCEKTFGMVYDALLYSLPRVSEEGMRKLLSKSPNPSEDRAIIERGFGICFCRAIPPWSLGCSLRPASKRFDRRKLLWKILLPHLQYSLRGQTLRALPPVYGRLGRRGTVNALLSPHWQDRLPRMLFCICGKLPTGQNSR